MAEYPKPITMQCLKNIYDQMNKYLYTIEEKENTFGICFFSYFKYRNKNIPIMITKYEKYLANYNSIKISTNNEIKTIEFGNVKYLNKYYNLAVIEINIKNSNIINFLEIEDRLYEKEYEFSYHRESIYNICYNKEKNISLSYGIIKKINNSEILYKGFQDKTEQCSPIFSLSNNKLIGIYKNTSKYHNVGIFLKFIIKEFIMEYIYSKNRFKFDKQLKNEIDVLIKINKKDIDKKIYYLDNYEYYENKDNKGIIHYHDNLKELNETNTELFIKDEKYGFKKYFIPKKIGEYNIKLKFNINLTDCSYMFAGCEKIINIRFVYFNTKYVTNMKYMFYKCNKLKNINLFSMNTQNVFYMSYMFYGCCDLFYLDLSTFDTKNVIDMNHMFSNCDNLNILDLSSFDTKNVIDMSDMFSFCINLDKLDLSIFDTKYVNNMDYMFYGCKKLKILNIPYCVNNKNKMNYIYENCPNLIIYSLYINDNNCINKYQNIIEILIHIYKSDIGHKIYFIDNYHNYDNFSDEESNFKELNELNAELFINEQKYKFNKFFIPYQVGDYNIKLKFNINLTDCSYMFAGCEKITNIKFVYFNTKCAINMEYMFYKCSSLSYLDLSSFNTKNVSDMNRMFYDCYNLKNIDLSSFETKNVNNMSEMFYECKNLKNLDLSSFETNNLIEMENMFYNCVKLNNLDLSSFNTKKVTEMPRLFYECNSLISLDLSSFDTSKVNDMSEMFYECNSLISLDLSSFDTSNVIDMSKMFYECQNLNYLDLSSFDIKNLDFVDGIFYRCKREIIDFNLPKFKKFGYDNLIKKPI